MTAPTAPDGFVPGHCKGDLVNPASPLAEFTLPHEHPGTQSLITIAIGLPGSWDCAPDLLQPVMNLLRERNITTTFTEAHAGLHNAADVPCHGISVWHTHAVAPEEAH